MNLVIDFRLGGNLGPFLSAFWEECWLDLARQFPDHRYYLLGSPAGSDLPLPGALTIEEIRSSSFRWLDQRRLLIWLAEKQATGLVRMQDRGCSLYRPAGPGGFRKKDLQLPFKKLIFTNIQLEAEKKARPADLLGLLTPALAPGPAAEEASWAEKENLKIRYSGGRDYFLYLGDLGETHLLVELLKAFSLFKKSQQSSMKLLLAGYELEWTETLSSLLKTYKYREEVELFTDLPDTELMRLPLAAYALLSTNQQGALPLEILLAQRQGLAVIAPDTALNREIAGGDAGALWVDRSDPVGGYSRALIEIFRDENKKQQLAAWSRQQGAAQDRPAMLAGLLSAF